MTPNLAMFARMAAPMPPPGMPMTAMPGRAQAPMPQMPAAVPPLPQNTASAGAPPVLPIKAGNVIRPVGGGKQAAAAGRGGDTMVAHMTPGEIAVPPQVQTPEVLATLNKAFAGAGANPTSFQAGNPDQKVNPQTGMPEFGFFDTLLPIGLGIAGSTLLGPEVLAPALGLEGASGFAGAIPGILGGAIGTTAGNLITGKPLGQSLAGGALGAIGGALGGAALGGGFGPTPMTDVVTGAAIPETGAPGAGLASDFIRNPGGMASLPGGGLSPLGYPLTTAAGAADTSAVTGTSFLDKAINALNLNNPGKLIGSTLGGMLGSNLGESLFPQGNSSPPVNLGPHLPPPGPVTDIVGGGNPALSGTVNAGAPTFPGSDYLRRYGQRPMFNYFPY